MENFEKLDITNTVGEQVFSIATIKKKVRVSIKVSMLRSGIYFATLRNKDGKSSSLKFVKL